MSQQPHHEFTTRLIWSGAEHGPTLDVATYSREIEAWLGERMLPMSAAPQFAGDVTRTNPEQLFVASVSSCHALTYLFLAARHGVGVVSYEDEAIGRLEMSDGIMRMVRVTLRPHIVLQPGADEARARALVQQAHRGCFIANSVVTTIEVLPRIDVVAHELVDAEC